MMRPRPHGESCVPGTDHFRIGVHLMGGGEIPDAAETELVDQVSKEIIAAFVIDRSLQISERLMNTAIRILAARGDVLSLCSFDSDDSQRLFSARNLRIHGEE
jgi:hypothetical protein